MTENKEKVSNTWIDKALLNEFESKYNLLEHMDECLEDLYIDKNNITSFIIGYTYINNEGEIASTFQIDGNSFNKYGLAKKIFVCAEDNLLNKT